MVQIKQQTNLAPREDPEMLSRGSTGSQNSEDSLLLDLLYRRDPFTELTELPSAHWNKQLDPLLSPIDYFTETWEN